MRSHHLFLKKNASFDRDSDELKLSKSTEEPIFNENSEVVMEERPNFEMRFKRFMDGCAGRDLLFGLLDSPNTTYTQALSFVNSTANVADDLLRTVSLALSEIEHEVPSVSGSHTFNKLLSASKNFKLTKFETQYQLLRYLKQQISFVSPREIVFGKEYERKEFQGKLIYKKILRTGQFIPISDVLKQVVLQHDKIFEICHAYKQLLSQLSLSGIVLDLMQTTGKLATKTENKILEVEAGTIETENSLDVVLQLYFDEIEPVNPIGSRTTIHKIGCFYWNLKNLPPG